MTFDCLLKQRLSVPRVSTPERARHRDTAGAILKGALVGTGSQDMRGIDDGRQGIAQFVTDHRQEFVLSTV